MKQPTWPATSVTNVTNLGLQIHKNCGTIVRTTMQVFTTIYLAETLRANVEYVEETDGLDQQLPGVIEFKHTIRERIAILENRWPCDDDGSLDD